jgi:uncharacterized LabA/DUF88 family protein
MSLEPRPLPKLRVITYIDGFNLYFGLREKAWQKYMWLDLCALSESLMKDSQILLKTKYFTSRISGSKSKEDRQSAYLDALSSLPDLQIFYGRFQDDRKECQKCGHAAFIPQEKKTDVNIATQLLCDAHANSFDVAMVVSADADLVPPIAAVRSLFPNKRVVVAFPPNRFSTELSKTADGWMRIYEPKFRQSQLPSPVIFTSGVQITKPRKWS